MFNVIVRLFEIFLSVCNLNESMYLTSNAVHELTYRVRKWTHDLHAWHWIFVSWNRMGCNATTVMRMWKTLIAENRRNQNLGSWTRNMNSSLDESHLIRMAVTFEWYPPLQHGYRCAIVCPYGSSTCDARSTFKYSSSQDSHQVEPSTMDSQKLPVACWLVRNHLLIASLYNLDL